jgi:hypothetical protein
VSAQHTPGPVAELVAALHLILDSVDYTAGACGLTEMVGAVLPTVVIERARAAIAKAEGRTA